MVVVPTCSSTAAKAIPAAAPIEFQVDDYVKALEDINSSSDKKMTPILEELERVIAKTGTPVVSWDVLRPFFLWRLEKIMKFMMENCPYDHLPPQPNVENAKASVYVDRILASAEKLDGVPFTVQRLFELLISPQKNYKRSDKFFRALEKNISVVSSVSMESFSNDALSHGMPNGFVHGVAADMTEETPALTNRASNSQVLGFQNGPDSNGFHTEVLSTQDWTVSSGCVEAEVQLQPEARTSSAVTTAAHSGSLTSSVRSDAATTLASAVSSSDSAHGYKYPMPSIAEIWNSRTANNNNHNSNAVEVSLVSSLSAISSTTISSASNIGDVGFASFASLGAPSADKQQYRFEPAPSTVVCEPLASLITSTAAIGGFWLSASSNVQHPLTTTNDLTSSTLISITTEETTEVASVEADSSTAVGEKHVCVTTLATPPTSIFVAGLDFATMTPLQLSPGASATPLGEVDHNAAEFINSQSLTENASSNAHSPISTSFSSSAQVTSGHSGFDISPCKAKTSTENYLPQSYVTSASDVQISDTNTGAVQSAVISSVSSTNNISLREFSPASSQVDEQPQSTGASSATLVPKPASSNVSSIEVSTPSSTSGNDEPPRKLSRWDVPPVSDVD